MPDGAREKPPKWAAELSAEVRAFLFRSEEDRRRYEEERRKSDARFAAWLKRMDAHLDRIDGHMERMDSHLKQAARDREDFKEDRRNFARLMTMVMNTGNRIVALLKDLRASNQAIVRELRSIRTRRNGLQGDGKK